MLPDERATTDAGFLTRAAVWFAAHGVTVRRVCTDNSLSHRRGADRIDACTRLAIGRRFIQPGRPWTNGRAGRFDRTRGPDGPAPPDAGTCTAVDAAGAR